VQWGSTSPSGWQTYWALRVRPDSVTLTFCLWYDFVVEHTHLPPLPLTLETD
jgi:hypothetical protein